MNTTRVAIGLGANLGDRLAALQGAVERLAGSPDLTPAAVGPVVESAYVGPGPDQPPYLNSVLVAEWTGGPERLLELLQETERCHGRRPGTHLQPRPLDCDLLLFGHQTVSTPRLRVPHPELARRAFVLEPLVAVAADWVVPDCGLTVGELCAIIRRDGRQRWRPWPGALRLPAPDRKEVP